MENHQSSSPDRVPPTTRKVTYLERKKRKRTISKPDSASSDSDSSTASLSGSFPMKTPDSGKEVKSPIPQGGKGPKKVDVSLPGPSPKRPRRDSEESNRQTKAKKAPDSHPTESHNSASQKLDQAMPRANCCKSTKAPKVKKVSSSQAAPSSSSVEGIHKNGISCSPDASQKPESTIRPSKSKKTKSITADEDIDDSVSIADSSLSITRTRRNESERIEYFKNQPECGKLEPRSVVCIICNKVVNLGRKQTYAVRPWEIHRARCDKKAALVALAMTTSEAEPEGAEAEPEASPTNVVLTVDPNAARRPSESDRKTFLENDKQVRELEQYRALCNKCSKWVELSSTLPYATGNWVKHKIRCSDAVPSNRVAAAKRKLLVVNDKQVKSFTPRKIDCAFCGVTIILEGEGDFNLTSWDEHKQKCTKSVPVSRSESINSIAFPSRVSRPPPSSASTEDTLVADLGTSRPGYGVKRLRDDSEAIPEEVNRPSARTRTSTYTAPDIEPPSSVMGWFMLPFHSFVRGFKESLKDRS